jgi:hypothetical protein
MHRTRTANRLATSLAIVAIMLRVLLPALHTHVHHDPAEANGDTGSAFVCSCGVVHPSEDRKDQDPRADSSPEGHQCLACEIEEGIPGDCPASLDWSVVSDRYAVPLAFADREILVANQLVLPQQRAPPKQRA